MSELKVHWQCDSCGVRAVSNPSVGEETEWDFEKSNGTQEASLFDGNPPREPVHVFSSGEKVCHNCLDFCDACGSKVCLTMEWKNGHKIFGFGRLDCGGNLYCASCLVDVCKYCGEIDCVCAICPFCSVPERYCMCIGAEDNIET